MPTARMEIYPGAVLLPGILSRGEQRELVQACRAIGTGATGWYVPTVRGGGQMRVRMLCLGRHWNASTYRYEACRADYDGRPAPPLPAALSSVAVRIAEAAGMGLTPDVCIVNYYDAAGKMGLHQDKDERQETLDAGFPIVSVSLGDTATFLVGGLRRRDPKVMVPLASGDGFVLGGESRLRFHGVAAIVPRTGPADLGLDGRLSLTFREGAAA